MDKSKVCFKIAKPAVIFTSLLLFGCGANNVHFTNTVIPPLPNVLPDPDEFKLTFTVQNDSDQTFPVGSLKVKVDALYHTDFRSETCYNNLEFSLGLLEPEQKIIMQSVEFEKNDYAGDPCRCFKGACAGHVTLSLTNGADQLKPGPKTKFQVTWKKSGDLADLSVVDQSD